MGMIFLGLKMVTVLLPTYNRRKYLKQALLSIKKQSFTNWKCLVINDGGDDVSDLVADMHDERFIYYIKEHSGKSATLNFGLRKVNTKYISYMDDDDIVFNNHLFELVTAAEKNKSEFVYSDTYVSIVDDNEKILKRYIENSLDVSFNDIKLHNKINHKQILHTLQLANKAGEYDEKMHILIDFDYIKRLAFFETPYHVRKITGDHFLRLKNGKINSISGL